MPMSSALTGAVDRNRCFFKRVVGKIDCMSRVLDILLFTNPSYLRNNDEILPNLPFILFHKIKVKSHDTYIYIFPKKDFVFFV